MKRISSLSGLFVFFFCIGCFYSSSLLAKCSPQAIRRDAVVIAVEKTSPAVVNIKAKRIIERYANPFRDLFGNDFFSPFFGNMFPGYKEKILEQSLGSGVIIDAKKRLVLTNAHVIMGASQISVKLLDGREFDAELVGSDPDFDIALLRIKGKGPLPQAKIGTSSDLMVGETVIAIGNPYGFSNTVTTGVVSALNRCVETPHGKYFGFIQTDAAINPGNSGGPLLNILGEVIGINTAIYARAQGIGFAIPIDKAKAVIYELLHYGKVKPVWLGIFGQDVDPSIASYLGLRQPQGMLVTEVIRNTPAWKKGIKPGDVILFINGYAIEDKDDYVRYLQNTTSETSLKLTIWRYGKKIQIVLRPENFPQSEVRLFIKKKWGFSAIKGNDCIVVSHVYSNSPASVLGLKPGDKIYRIAGVRTKDIQDLIHAYIRYRLQRSIIMLVFRGGRGYYVRLSM